MHDVFAIHGFTEKNRKWWLKSCCHFQFQCSLGPIQWHATKTVILRAALLLLLLLLITDATQISKTSVVHFCWLTASSFLSAAACCPLWVSAHPGQPVSVSPLLHGWRQAYTHSHNLHCPAHLEHGALHPASGRLSGQTEPSAGNSTCKFEKQEKKRFVTFVDFMMAWSNLKGFY